MEFITPREEGQYTIQIIPRNIDNEIEVSLLLHHYVRRLPQDTFTYRIINHWEKNGLINSIRKQEGAWREFSLIDIVWLHIINELREFGLSLKKIAAIKSELENLYGKQKPIPQSRFPYFEYYVGLALFVRRSVTLLVYLDNKVEVMTDEELIKSFHTYEKASYISISINNILKKAIPEGNYTPLYFNWTTMSESEIELIGYVRDPKTHLIRVKKSDDKISMLEATEKVKGSNIHDLRLEHPYQSIKTDTENFKTVNVERTVKKRYSTKKDKGLLN